MVREEGERGEIALLLEMKREEDHTRRITKYQLCSGPSNGIQVSSGVSHASEQL